MYNKHDCNGNLFVDSPMRGEKIASSRSLRSREWHLKPKTNHLEYLYLLCLNVYMLSQSLLDLVEFS